MGSIHWQRVENCDLGGTNRSGYAKQDREKYLHESSSGWIGTDGLAVCVALIVAGQDSQHQWKAAIHHYSGADDPDEIFDDMIAHLREAGMAGTPALYAVGGSTGQDRSEPIDRVLQLRQTPRFAGLTVLRNEREYREPHEQNPDTSAAAVKIYVVGEDLRIQCSGLTTYQLLPS